MVPTSYPSLLQLRRVVPILKPISCCRFLGAGQSGGSACGVNGLPDVGGLCLKRVSLWSLSEWHLDLDLTKPRR